MREYKNTYLFKKIPSKIYWIFFAQPEHGRGFECCGKEEEILKYIFRLDEGNDCNKVRIL